MVPSAQAVAEKGDEEAAAEMAKVVAAQLDEEETAAKKKEEEAAAEMAKAEAARLDEEEAAAKEKEEEAAAKLAKEVAARLDEEEAAAKKAKEEAERLAGKRAVQKTAAEVEEMTEEEVAVRKAKKEAADKKIEEGVAAMMARLADREVEWNDAARRQVPPRSAPALLLSENAGRVCPRQDFPRNLSRGAYTTIPPRIQVELVCVPYVPPCPTFSQLTWVSLILLWWVCPEFLQWVIQAVLAVEEGYQSLCRVAQGAPAYFRECVEQGVWWVRQTLLISRQIIYRECEYMWDDVQTWVQYARTGNFYNPHGNWVVPMYKKVYNAILGNPMRCVYGQISLPLYTLNWVVRQNLGWEDEWEWVQWTWVDSGEMDWAYAEGIDAARCVGEKGRNFFGTLNCFPAELILHIRKFLHPGYDVCLFQKLCPEIFEVCCRQKNPPPNHVEYHGHACDMCGVWDKFWLCEGVRVDWTEGTFCSLRCFKMAHWEQWEDPHRY